MNSPSKKIIFRLLATVVLFLGAAFIGFYGLLILLFSGTETRYNIPIFFLYLIVLFVCTYFIWRFPFFPKKLLIIISCFLIIFIGGQAAYDAYERSIPIVSDEVDLSIYRPFEKESPIARLDRPAAFTLKGDLPRLDGATALYPIMCAFVEATYPPGDYQLNKSDVFQMTTTPYAYKRLINGETDIIFVAAPSEKQILEAEKQNSHLILTPIGKEGFVFFVNAKNPIDSLTIEEIQGIYSGKITNWKEVGGPNESIRPFQRPEGSGSQSALLRLMKDRQLIEAPTENIVTGMGGIIKQTADYKNFSNAIGFSFRFYSTQMVKNNEIKLLKIEGIAPDESSIRDGSYPFTSDFYAVTTEKSQENPNVQKLLTWILSEEGQSLIEKTGYIKIK